MRFLRRSKKAQEIAAAREQSRVALDALTADAIESKNALEAMASQTRAIAEDITLKLRGDLMDKMREIELTASMITDAMLICGEDGTVKSMNRVAEAMFHRSAAHDATIQVQDLIRIDSIDYWDALVSRPHAARVVRDGGVMIPCTMNVAKLERIDATPDYIVMIHALAEAESVETAAIINKGTVVLREGFIIAVNEEIAHLLGYSASDLLGMPFASVIALKDQPFVDTQISNPDLEASFETTIVTQAGIHLLTKMAITFVPLQDAHLNAVVTIESIGEDVMNRKIDVLRCFGEDFFFRSSTFIVPGEDMFLYLTPDLTVKYLSETFRRFLMTESKDVVGVPLRDLLSATEFKVAQLHFQSLTPTDSQRSISMHLKNTNAGSHQEWTDRAFYDAEGNLLEYRRSGTSKQTVQ